MGPRSVTLAELQRDFRAWLEVEATPDFGQRAVPGLRVYQNNYRAQLAACLEASFPHTLSWIGGGAFHAAVVAHVERVPPSSWTLDAYPRDFADTLRQRYPADPEVFELANLERALDDAFVGADADPVQASALAEIDWDRAVLRFAPTLELADATTNAAAIWSALAAGDVPPPTVFLPEPATLLVWRQAMVSQFRTIDATERHMLLLARAGAPFAALCATLVEARGEADGIAQAGTYLGRWLADGLIVDIEGDEACASPRPWSASA